MIKAYTQTEVSVGPQGLIIYAELANLAYFSSATFTPKNLSSADAMVTIKAATVRDYPGDSNTFSRRSFQARKWSAPYRRGSSTPGKLFWLIDPTPDAETGGPTQKREFTYQGALLDLYNLFVASAKINLELMASSGRVYPIEAN
jgi:hypothetical protein